MRRKQRSLVGRYIKGVSVAREDSRFFVSSYFVFFRLSTFVDLRSFLHKICQRQTMQSPQHQQTKLESSQRTRQNVETNTADDHTFAVSIFGGNRHSLLLVGNDGYLRSRPSCFRVSKSRYKADCAYIENRQARVLGNKIVLAGRHLRKHLQYHPQFILNEDETMEQKEE